MKIIKEKIQNNAIFKGFILLLKILFFSFITLFIAYVLMVYYPDKFLFIILLTLFVLFYAIFVLFYAILFSDKIRQFFDRDKIKKVLKILNSLSILFASLSIILAVFQFYRSYEIDKQEKRDTYRDIEQSLLTENELNKKCADSILSDEEKKWFYWNEFSLLNYKPNLNYIMRYKNEECQIKYLQIMNAMEVANNANSALINLGIQKILILTSAQLKLYDEKFKDLKDLIQKNASTTQNNIDYIIKNCITNW